MKKMTKTKETNRIRIETDNKTDPEKTKTTAREEIGEEEGRIIVVRATVEEDKVKEDKTTEEIGATDTTEMTKEVEAEIKKTAKTAKTTGNKEPEITRQDIVRATKTKDTTKEITKEKTTVIIRMTITGEIKTNKVTIVDK